MAVAPSDDDRVAGCLLGGAVGDALDAPVEFMSLAEIRERFGPSGIRHYAPVYGRLGAITDDTQMTLFTAGGLIRGMHRWRDRGGGYCDQRQSHGCTGRVRARWLA